MAYLTTKKLKIYGDSFENRCHGYFQVVRLPSAWLHEVFQFPYRARTIWLRLSDIPNRDRLAFSIEAVGLGILFLTCTHRKGIRVGRNFKAWALYGGGRSGEMGDTYYLELWYEDE